MGFVGKGCEARFGRIVKRLSVMMLVSKQEARTKTNSNIQYLLLSIDTSFDNEGMSSIKNY